MDRPRLKAMGTAIAQERVRRHLTQERLAEMLGITSKYMSLIERGLSAPSFDVLNAISEALTMSLVPLATIVPLNTQERVLAKMAPYSEVQIDRMILLYEASVVALPASVQPKA